MTRPALSVQVTGRGRHYRHPRTGELYPSVTTIIETLAKPWLGAWMAKLVAGYAWDNRMALLEMSDREAAVDFLKGAPRRQRDSAAGVGDLVHEVVEARVLGRPEPEIPEHAAPYVAAWEAFAKDTGIVFTHSEETVFNGSEGYAGTFDFLGRIGGLRVLGDYKTGSGIYDEVILQLAALRYAPELWDSQAQDSVDMPPVDRCIAVHLQPDGYRVHLIDAGERAYDAFLGLLAAWRWNTDHVGAVGHPLRGADEVRAALGIRVQEAPKGGPEPPTLGPSATQPRLEVSS